MSLPVEGNFVNVIGVTMEKPESALVESLELSLPAAKENIDLSIKSNRIPQPIPLRLA